MRATDRGVLIWLIVAVPTSLGMLTWPHAGPWLMKAWAYLHASPATWIQVLGAIGAIALAILAAAFHQLISVHWDDEPEAASPVSEPVPLDEPATRVAGGEGLSPSAALGGDLAVRWETMRALHPRQATRTDPITSG